MCMWSPVTSAGVMFAAFRLKFHALESAEPVGVSSVEFRFCVLRPEKRVKESTLMYRV